MKRLFLLILKLALACIALSILWVFAYRYIPVRLTPLMIKRAYEYKDDSEFHTTQKWVPLEKISPEMWRAVIASEDNRFMDHNGFDIEELKKMYKAHLEDGKDLRGCSTISQQTAKNCFTFCSDTWFRKGVEAYYTFLIEKIWGKRRIMEVYLNIAEMGKGIYGVQAASEHYYHVSALNLKRQEAIRLAVILPSPLKRNPLRNTEYMQGRIKALTDLETKLKYPEW